jgi:hypothetical protein
MLPPVLFDQAAVRQLEPKPLLMLMLGIANMKVRPAAGWCPAVLQAVATKLPLMSPSQLSNMMLACGKLQMAPSQAFLRAYQAAWEAQMPQLTAKDHALVLWGVGKMALSNAATGARNQLPWVWQVQQALQQAVNRAVGAVAAVALQKLRQASLQQQTHAHEQIREPEEQQQLVLAPDLKQMEGQERHDVHQQPTTNKPRAALPRELLLSNNRDLQQQQQQQHVLQQQQPPAHFHADEPPPALLAQQQHHHHHQQQHQPAHPSELQQFQGSNVSTEVQAEQPPLLSSASLLHPTDCAMVLYALARLGPAAVETSFTSFWLRQSKSQLGNMNSKELATCCWALGRLALRPPQDWLQQHLWCTSQLASCMSHRQLAMVLWGCARLQVGGYCLLLNRLWCQVPDSCELIPN